MARHSAPETDAANGPKLIAAWLFVGVPFAWGVFVTAGNAIKLFR
jgi:hypothetical protein